MHKFLKTLFLIPVFGWMLALFALTLTAPLFVTWITHAIYREALSSTWKIFTYTAGIVAEISLIVAFALDTAPIVYVGITIFVWIVCAITAIVCNSRKGRS